MKKIILLLIIILLSFVAFGYNKRVLHLKIINNPHRTAFIYVETNFGKAILDSVAIFNYELNFDISPEVEQKFIYISFNSELTNPIVILNEDIIDTIHVFSKDVNFIENVEINNSEINHHFYKCLKYQINYSNKLGILYDDLLRLNKKDDLYLEVYSLYQKLYKEYRVKINKELKYFDINKQIFLKSYISFQERIIFNYLIFDTISYFNIDDQFNLINANEELVYSELVELLFNNIAIKYSNSNNEKEIFTNIHNSLISLISSKNANPVLITKLTNHYINYLYQLKQFNLISDFFNENPSLNHIKDKYNFLYLGLKLDDFYGVDSNSNINSINDHHGKGKILIIWSSECSHCIDLINQLNKSFNKIESDNNVILSFCIQNYFKSEHQLKLNWRDQLFLVNGFNNTYLKRFNINFTPFIIILDKNNRVIGFPSVDEFIATINTD